MIKEKQMYKVFIDEKKIILTKFPIISDKNIYFSDHTSFKGAISALKNTSSRSVNIYHDNLQVLWTEFRKQFRCIDAAGGVVSNNENKILFIYRNSRWDLPKGKIEDGESVKTAAIREVEEECSIFDLEIKNFITSTHHIYIGEKDESILKTTYWYMITYSGDSVPSPQKIEGITKTEWKSLTEIHSDIYNDTFHNIQLVLDNVLN